MTTTTTVTMTFQVAYFENAEGGMDCDYFGGEVSTLEAAVEQWRLANLAQPKHDWVIVTTPEVNVSVGKGGAQ